MDVYIEPALLEQVNALHLEVRGFTPGPGTSRSDMALTAASTDEDTTVARDADDSVNMTDWAPLEGPKLDFPLTYALAPRNGDANRRYLATFTLRKDTENIAVMRVESGFLAGKIIRLSVNFSEACVGVDCEPSETCEEGLCQTAMVDEQQLPAFDPRDAPSAGADGQAGQGGVPRRAPRGNAAGVGGDGSVAQGTDACGDGKRGASEKCDTAIESGNGACPTACPNDNPCELGIIDGAECQQTCVYTPIANSPLPQCVAVCGNGKRESDETCDPMEECLKIVEDCTPLPASCFKGVISGAADKCTSACEPTAIIDCAGADGCCPLGCDSLNDSDCSMTCGNGMLDLLETCDGTQSPCPTTCDDGDACTRDVMSGTPSQCNVLCAHFEVTLAAGGDGCCPSGVNPRNDSDCMQPEAGSAPPPVGGAGSGAAGATNPPVGGAGAGGAGAGGAGAGGAGAGGAGAGGAGAGGAGAGGAGAGGAGAGGAGAGGAGAGGAGAGGAGAGGAGVGGAGEGGAGTSGAGAGGAGEAGGNEPEPQPAEPDAPTP